MINKKITSEIAIGIVLSVAIIIGGIFWLQSRNQTLTRPAGSNTNRANSNSTSSTQQLSAADNSFDADGFLWGTEGYMTMMETDGQKQIDTIKNTLKVKNIKVRLWDDKNFTPDLCMGPNCEKKYNLDAFAKIFKENNWSMRPMFMPQCFNTLNCSDSDIENYVNYIDWFIGRYKNNASIKYIELLNAPAPASDEGVKGLPGFPLTQLVDIQNKVYDRIKNKYPDIMVGTHGFEYQFDAVDPGKPSIAKSVVPMVDYFLDKNNGAKFDYWAFHGYATFLSPVQIPTNNKYAGISGIMEIRKKMDANGWQNRLIIDTEHTPSSGSILSAEQDKFDSIQTIQELTIKRTLVYNGKRVLSGITPLKTISRGDVGEHLWGSLNSDSLPTQTMKATALLWSILNEYNYESHFSGAFGDDTTAWVEKFKSGDTKELYIFFRPISIAKEEIITPDSYKSLIPLLDQQTSNYTLNLNRQPKSVTITDIDGTIHSLTPSQSITLNVINSTKYLEVAY